MVEGVWLIGSGKGVVDGGWFFLWVYEDCMAWRWREEKESEGGDFLV